MAQSTRFYRKDHPFWDLVRKTDTCWWWEGALNNYGYGKYGIPLAHRLAYLDAVGPIPDGLTLDHLCRNPRCVNPAHLEPVTLAENTLRGYGPTAENARKTHCINGHPFSGDNLFVYMRAGRQVRECRTCRRDRAAARRAA